jgi:beige protein homolog 1
VALELFFSDGRSCLITLSPSDRNRAYNKLIARIQTKIPNSIFQGVDGMEDLKGAGAAALTSQLGSRLVNVLSATHSIPATKSWEKGLISNFHYLMILNSLASRSYNDLTQYPVAPWVLADYTSGELDLTNPATFRDFSKPMGAQVPEREADFEERYRSFEEIEDRTQPAFHYGTHYSSAMIVCSYLIRLQPLVESYLLLQGGQFDHAERLFHSIGKAWNSASRDNMTDVRELIPEFFYLDAFLSNHNSFNFGVKQDDGEVIDSVVLPPWAKGDPKVFIQRHREALECDYVSEHLHGLSILSRTNVEWIDLIFGYKQRGEAAIKATNVFHHLSYQGSIDLEKILDPIERLASINIIHNFGQTPKQLFTRPHPKRRVDPQAVHFEDHLSDLRQPATPIQIHTEPVTSLFATSDRVLSGCGQKVFIPSKGEYYLEWGFSDGSLRVFTVEGDRLIGLAENLHSSPITCAVFADENTLITGSEDTTVCVWQVRIAKTFEIQLKECLRGHSEQVSCIAFSKSFSVIVSGSDDGTAIVWDLNRLKYVRQLTGHVGPVEAVAVNDATGDIATCSGPNLHWWTVNGDLFADQMICADSRKGILACVFYEGVGQEWIARDLLFTAHKDGVVRVISSEMKC